jgi:hypothetical protein
VVRKPLYFVLANLFEGIGVTTFDPSPNRSKSSFNSFGGIRLRPALGCLWQRNSAATDLVAIRPTPEEMDGSELARLGVRRLIVVDKIQQPVLGVLRKS